MALLPDLYFSKFVFELKFINNVSFPPFWGSVLKSEFLRHFKYTLCLEKTLDCDKCLLTSNCKYYKLFEKEQNFPDYVYLKHLKKFPIPLIINQPETSKRKFATNDRLEISITIFGKYVDLFDNVKEAFINWGSNGVGKEKAKFIITNIFVTDYKDKQTNAINKENGLLEINLPNINSDIFNKLNYAKYTKAVVDFNTPLQLLKKGNVITKREEFNLRILLNEIEKRFLTIAFLYCNNNLENTQIVDRSWEIPEIISNTLKSIQVSKPNKSFKNSKNSGDNFALMGNLILAGDFTKIGPILHIGSFIGIGKNIISGFGKYTIIFK